MLPLSIISGVSAAGIGGATSLPVGLGGLLSQAGSWIAANPALALGMGAMGYSALGGSSSGTAISSQINLTERGTKLESQLYKSIKENKLFPENLASRFIGQAKKAEQARRKIFETAFKGATATGPKTAVSGNVAKAFLAETESRLKGAQEGYRQVGEARRTYTLNRLGKLQNFMNLQMQTPIMRAQADLINQELAQARGAERGATLGSILQLLALGATLK